MANSYFQFKQFRVDQELCALKVCTDACIQGAVTGLWFARHWKANGLNAKVLDIGCGTGLLSLMLAQRLPAALIEAVELDAAACRQAEANFRQSPWSKRLRLAAADVRCFEPGTRYQFIITNPPFYENNLKSGHAGKNRAKHSVSLNHDELLDSVGRLLDTDGFLSVMLPAEAFDRWCAKASARGLYPLEVLDVSQSPAHGTFRTIGLFSRAEIRPGRNALCITDERRRYSEDARKLLDAYYLYFPGDRSALASPASFPSTKDCR